VLVELRCRHAPQLRESTIRPLSRPGLTFVKPLSDRRVQTCESRDDAQAPAERGVAA